MDQQFQIDHLVQTCLPMQLDCVSWNKTHDILALGAYELIEADSLTRIGRIYLVKLEPKTHGELITILDELDTPGVLDLKWDPFKEEKLAVATATSIQFYTIDVSSTTVKLEKMGMYELEWNVMGLYLDWMEEAKIVYSDSEGSVTILTANNEPAIETTQKLHENLTWVVKYCPDNQIFYAGADDGRFTAFTVEHMNVEDNHFVKRYEVGVTSIITKGNIVAVGSYDDHLRLYNLTETNPKVNLQLKLEVKLGGTVWRTLWIPPLKKRDDKIEELYIGAALARNGVHIVKIDTESWTSKTVFSCTDYIGALAYGIDVKVNKDNYTVSTCYFDNHVFHVFNVKPLVSLPKN